MHNNRNNRKDNIGSIFGSVFALAFGIVWCIIVARAAPFMIVFGLIFIGIAIANIVRVIICSKNSNNNINYIENEYNEMPYSDDQYNFFEQLENKSKKHVASCPFCKKTVSITDKYCKNCGSKI